ncbi:MAG: FAD:protein FMN transferase [Aeromicrobium erythreum]
MPRPDPVLAGPVAPWRFDAIGTAWTVDAVDEVDAHARAAVADLVARFDRTWSRFRDDSLVAEVAAAPGTWELPAEAEPLLALYGRLHAITAGAVSPLVGRRLADLGYGSGYALRPVADPAHVPAWSSITWSPPLLTTTEPVVLDVGAAGKGLLVDLVAAELAHHGVPGVVVDASGDLRHDGSGPLRVALEHPHDPTLAVGVADLPPGRSLAGSAVNRRAWADDLHHVLDARTGRPTRDVVASWVVADSCLLADGAATAAFFVPPDELAATLGVEVVRLRADGRLEWSPGFPGEMFT